MNELTEFKQSDSFSIKALSIFAKYVQGTSVEYFGGDLALREECCAYFSNRRQADDSVRLEDAISHFRWLFCACFNVLFDKVYVSFRQSSDYLAAFKLAKTRFNVVRYDDFDYFGALGTGACGIVVKCRKKSTGKVYAMKIQRKTAQFEQFETEPWRVEDEKVAHAWLNSPYIVKFAYSLQSVSMTMLVLDIGELGDLRTILANLPNGCLPDVQCVAYAGEIVSALCCMHEMGILYRDLKPGNILLCADGHIKLTDLGAAKDLSGLTVSAFDGAENLMPVFRPPSEGTVPRLSAKFKSQKSKTRTDSVSLHSASESFQHEFRSGAAAKFDEKGQIAHQLKNYSSYGLRARTYTLVGRMGYMAPEIMALHSCKSRPSGYTFSCDWWSLGATMFKLYTGMRPYAYKKPSGEAKVLPSSSNSVSSHAFASSSSANYHDQPGCELLEESDNENPAFDETEYRYRGMIKYDKSLFSTDAEDFIGRLLTMDPATRLGSGPDPYQEVTDHHYFDQTDFFLLERKLVPAAPLPIKANYKRKSMFGVAGAPDLPRTFEEIMTELGYSRWLTERCTHLGGYFEHWNSTAPYVVAYEADCLNTQ